MKKNLAVKFLNSFKKLSELDDDLKLIINKYKLPVIKVMTDNKIETIEK